MAASSEPRTGPGNSAFKRYAPFIAVVAVIAIVVGVLVATSGSGSKKKQPGTTTAVASKAPWPSYSEAQAANTVSKYTWDSNCNTATGLVKLPSWDGPPCMAAFSGDNGGATAPGVTKDTIRIAYYSAPPDPSADALAKSVNAYDSPEQVGATNLGFLEAFAKRVQLYGRKVQLVKLQGTGTSNDEQKAQADAQTAKSLNVFAVLGGPSQTVSFSQTLANEGILCIGSCLISRPGAFYKANSPYIWPGIEPDQTSTFNTEFVKKQLANKDAIYAGDAKFRKEKRTFAILSYDNQGAFKPVWDAWKKKLEAAGVPIKGQVTYLLNIPTVQSDAQSFVQQLKAIDATTVLFTGDPFTPIYITKEATKQGYFPEWVMAGTVFADTSVFGRQYDPKQWAHAFGMSLIPPRIPVTQSRYYAIYTDCGKTAAPPAYNTQGIIYANEDLLFTGLELAGPHLTAQNFYAGMTAYPVPRRDDPADLRPVSSYGDHGIWPDGTDYGSTDTTGFVWWDPKAPGEDETGNTGTGQYRYIENGRQFLPGEVPSTPMGLFKTADTVTYYDNSGKYEGTKPVPASLKPLPCQS